MKFKVVSGSANPAESAGGDPHARIQAMIESNPVFLFMKGTPEAPQCGFSYKACQILNAWKVPFQTFNVFEDEAIRQGIKSFANWPTIPQLYIKQQFIGGCDIMEELAESGELGEILQAALPEFKVTPPPPPAQVKSISPEEADRLLKTVPNARLLDVRSPQEFQRARVEGAILLNEEIVEEILSSWEPHTPLVLICHHGMRSFDAARFFTAQGFQDVSNVSGGMERWSQTVDPNIPRY